MADLNQFINSQGLSADDVSHSSGFGAVAGGGGAGGLSMEQRRKLLNQPRVVGAYNKSVLGRQRGTSVAKTADQKSGAVYDPSTGQTSETASYGGNNRQSSAISDAGQIDQSVERRQHFIEPTPRNYDKYG